MVDSTKITHDNNRHAYRISMDIAKEGSAVWDLTPYFKGRVGDNRFGLEVSWFYQGKPMNVDGMKPYIEGNVGNYTLDDKKNLQLNSGASVVRYVGDPSDCGPGGNATYYFPEQMFPKEGIFKGYIGLLDDRDDSKNSHISGVTIWFRVLPGIAEMGHACDYYISELEKLLEHFKTTMNNHDKDYQAKLEQALADIRNKYNLKAQQAEDGLNNINKNISTTNDALNAVSLNLDAMKEQIKANNVITNSQYGKDMENIKNVVKDQLANITYAPSTTPSLTNLQNDYPNGKDGIFVAMDNGHKYIWYNNEWRDSGVYQGIELSDSTVTEVARKLNNQSGNYWSIQTLAYTSATYKADDNSWLLGNKYPAGYIKNINLKVDTPTNAKLWLFKYDREDLQDSNLNITLIDEFDITSETVEVNEKIDFPFIIGIKCKDALYSYDYPALTANLGQIKVGETYKFHLNPNKIDFALRVTYSSINTSTPKNDNVILLNTKQPTYSDNIYPIIFDFTKNKAFIDGFFIHKNYFNGNEVLSGGGRTELDLPPLNIKSSGYQNYFIVERDGQLKIKYFDGGSLNDSANKLDWNILAGISVADQASSFKKKCYFYSGINNDLIKVIFHVPESDASMEWYDTATKKIQKLDLYHYTYAAMGDSLTHAEDPNNGYKSALGHRYTDWVSKTLGMAAYNYGIGGASVRHTDNNKGMVDRVKNIPQADIISILGGTNDKWGNGEIGKADDNDLTHFASAFDSALKTMLALPGKRFSNPIVFVITPPKSRFMMEPNDKGYTLEDYVKVEKELAAKYGIPVLDLFNTFQFTDYETNENFKKKWMPDQAHPTVQGYDVIGIRVSNFIKNLIGELK